MKHTYSVQVQDSAGAWHTIVDPGETMGFCYGYVACAIEQPGPRLACRAIRSDDRVMASAHALSEVSIGQVAGFPTADQYQDAGLRALELGRQIRAKGGR